MSKLTIEIDSDTHARLKKLALSDERSLTQYIGRVLRQHAGTLTSTPTPTPTLPKKKRTSIVGDDDEEDPWSL